MTAKVKLGRAAGSRLRYDAALPLSLGCTLCPDREVCGGLRVEAPVFDCRSLCACASAEGCSGVCRGDARHFISRVREVGGFGFDTVPRARPLPLPAMATYAPIIYDGTNRRRRLAVEAVALPLMRLFNRTTGAPRFTSRAALLRSFKISADTRIMVTGVDLDRAIERWWSFRDRSRLIEVLRAIGVAMVTAPNYSLFTNASRYDNLHNMKRIALACAEFMAGGIPCALHVNGRTDRDYERWAEYIGEREEISLISFEFTTGTAGRRGAYHCEHLVRLAEEVRRPLHLVMRGGSEHLPALARAFASVSILDADPYVKTKHRRRGHLVMGADVEWQTSPTEEGEPLDALLRHNVMVKGYSTNLRLSWLRADYGHRKSRRTSPLLQARLA